MLIKSANLSFEEFVKLNRIKLKSKCECGDHLDVAEYGYQKYKDGNMYAIVTFNHTCKHRNNSFQAVPVNKKARDMWKGLIG